MTRVAAFDCGTNSLRLLICDLGSSGSARELHREMRVVRMGEGVDRTGRIGEPAMQRVHTALVDYAEVVARHDVERVRFCATSAARDAENAAEFAAMVRSVIGIDPEVLTGAEEAQLSFTGAVGSLRGALPEPHLVVDIGGGSTELVLGGSEIVAAQSLDIGAVRITERHLHTDPPAAEEIAAAVTDIDAALDAVQVDLASAASVIGVAGTITTLAAGALRLSAYERQLIHHSVVDVASFQGTVVSMLAMTVDERKALGYMHPGRADVIGGGGLVLDRLLRRTPVRSVLVSEHDILDGIAWSMSDAHAAPQLDNKS